MVLTKIYWNSNVTYISIVTFVTFCHCISIYKCAVRYVYHGIYMVQAHYEASKFHTILGNKPQIITVFRFSLSHIYIITLKRRVSICQFGIKWCYQNNVTMITIIFLAITSYPSNWATDNKYNSLQLHIQVCNTTEGNIAISGAHTHTHTKVINHCQIYITTRVWIMICKYCWNLHSFSLLTIFTHSHLLYDYLHKLFSIPSLFFPPPLLFSLIWTWFTSLPQPWLWAIIDILWWVSTF